MKVKCIVTPWILFVGFHPAMVAQSNPPRVIQHAGNASCSNVVLNQSSATFKCSGLSAEQAKLIERMPSLINKLLTNEHADSERIVSKLDLVLAGQDSMSNLLQEMDRALNPNIAVKVYNCEGVSRTSIPGGMTNIYKDPDFPAARMASSLNSGKFDQVLELANQQIREKPGWLTPYLFIAYVQIYRGDIKGAKEAFDLFEARKGDAYEDQDCINLEQNVQAKLNALPSK